MNKNHLLCIRTIRKLMLVFFLLLLFDVGIYAQSTFTAKGTVLDEVTKEPLIGVSVGERGSTTNRTITDLEGNFELKVTPTAELVFSYIGYNTTTRRATNDLMAVYLTENTKILDEVVVVGYGTQKKINLTGAVSSIKVDEQMAGRSLTNISSGLSGMVPGLSVLQNTGFAGFDGGTLQIRGLGSVNNSAPLIVVDGMPDVDMNRINMADIESISVLKDAASAAVYGSRAANGVILITTRSGKNESKAKISYAGWYGISDATNFYDYLADYPRAMTMQMRAAGAGNSASNFREGTVEQWMAMSMVDPILFPNTNQYDEMFRQGKLQNHTISASGGTDHSNFYLSLAVTDQEGLQLRNNYTRYNMRLNLDHKIRKNITVGMKTDGQWTETQFPRGAGLENAGLQYAVSGILNVHPQTGQYGGAMAYGENSAAGNMRAEYDLYTNNRTRQEYNASIYGDWEVIKGLKFNVNFGLHYYNQFTKSFQDPTAQWNFQTGQIARTMPPDDGLSNQIYQGHKTLFQGRVNYDKEIIKGHALSLMFNAADEYWFDRGLYGYRKDRVDASLTELDATGKTTQLTNGNSSAEGLRSFIGRLNYAIHSKYLLEANFRYDGSSKFTKGNQYGFFPSVALGWRLSEELFFENLKNVVSNTKLRVSMGALGNNAGVDRYEQKNVFANTSYLFNNSVSKGYIANKMINKDFSWEKTTVTNIGLDLGFFNNRLTAEIDWYDRLTSDMIRPSDLSSLLSGYSAPRKNIGNLRNRGMELNLTWTSNVSDFHYSVNFNASYNKNRLEKWNEHLSRGWVFLDMPYHYVYSYVDNGLAQSWNDIYNSPFQNSSYMSPGDIVLQDLNGDGQITDADKRAFENKYRDTPIGQLGLNLSAQYKGFDFSTLIQSSLGRWDYWIDPFNNVNIPSDRYGFQEYHWNDTWSLDNRNASMPRMITGSGGTKNREESTFWLYNASFVRLKNIQLGYSLPKSFINKATLEQVRIYFTGENLLTFSQWKGIDPEKPKGDNADLYPIVRSFSIGLNIAF